MARKIRHIRCFRRRCPPLIARGRARETSRVPHSRACRAEHARIHRLCSHRLPPIAFFRSSRRAASGMAPPRAHADRPRYLSPLDFHRGNVARSLARGRALRFVRFSRLVPARSFRGILAEGGGGTAGLGGHKETSAVVAVKNVVSLPGNLLVMLISTHKPFITADEQLIRLPSPLRPTEC